LRLLNCLAVSTPLNRYEMQKTCVRMDDGRTLTYYDFAAQGQTPPYLEIHQKAAQADPPTGPRILPQPPEMRWNPTLGEWTVFAANRMNRPQLPSKDACPLCPGILELPLPYQVAVFENRAPSMAYIPEDVQFPQSDSIYEMTAPARGRCDLVVYSQEHDSKLAAMPVNDVYCLVEAWRDRYAELVAQPDIRCVSIFENKGRDAGMTLDHPHGQIYSFSFLPPNVQKQWVQTVELAHNGGLWQSIIDKELRDGSRIIAETDGFLAAQPYFARYPYEVHIWAKREGVHSLLEMTPDERRQLAGMLKSLVTRYEKLWPGNAIGFPTLMLMYQLSNLPGVENYRFHIEYLPLQRSPEKLKYRASVESGPGTFLNDALPETQAAELKAVAPPTVELPDILFG
jgi:UDPglucose--hexose-1-phosphate uridylyltransferase